MRRLSSEEGVVLRGERHWKTRVDEHSTVCNCLQRSRSFEREAHADEQLQQQQRVKQQQLEFLNNTCTRINNRFIVYRSFVESVGSDSTYDDGAVERVQFGERQEAVIVHEGGQRGERAERTSDRSTCGSITARVTPHRSRGWERGRRGCREGGQRAPQHEVGGLVRGIGGCGGLREGHSGVQLEAHLRVQELEQLAGAAPRLERLPVDERARSASIAEYNIHIHYPI